METFKRITIKTYKFIGTVYGEDAYLEVPAKNIEEAEEKIAAMCGDMLMRLFSINKWEC